MTGPISGKSGKVGLEKMGSSGRGQRVYPKEAHRWGYCSVMG